MSDFDCKFVTSWLSVLFCQEDTPISGGRDLENVCNNGIVEDDALRDSNVNVAFIILDVSCCPLKKPNSEGKAGVNVNTEGSNEDIKSEDSNSVCPDSVS